MLRNVLQKSRECDIIAKFDAGGFTPHDQLRNLVSLRVRHANH